MAPQAQTPLGFDEVVDTFSDAINIAIGFENKFSDGIQFTDAFQIVEAYPRIVEIYNDWPVFKAQFADLTEEESAEAIKQIAERTKTSESFVAAYANKALSLSARIYRNVTFLIDEFKQISEEVKDFGVRA